MATRSGWAAALRSPLGATTAVLVGVLLLMAVVAPLIWGEAADRIDTGSLRQGSSAQHWLGTDTLGRDIFARVLVATSLSVFLALAATLLGVVTGVLLGSVPWLLGRRIGRWMVTAINIAVAFPSLLLALFIAVIFGAGLQSAVLAIGLSFAPYFARLTYTLVAGIQQREFVTAAQIIGVSKGRNLIRHILPNIGEPLVVNATVGAGSALLALAGLSFLGLGVQAPLFDWGLLLNQGLSGIYVTPAAALAPGAAIVLAGLAFNLFGEVLAKKIGLHTDFAVARPRRRRPLDAALLDRPGPGGDTRPSAAGGAAAPVLIVDDLEVTLQGASRPITPVRGVSFDIAAGEAVGMVGESGSGKSLTALAVARLIEFPGHVDARRLEFLGTDLLGRGPRALARLLGTRLGMVFQDPGTSLNPTIRVGTQLAEIGIRHLGMTRKQGLARAIERLRGAHIPAARQRARQYPHEFSGGMRQRAMIAMSIMGDPALIIADEPTTALDVTVQREVLRLLQEVRDESDSAILFISHDITVVRQVCDRVLVMYAGRIVEDLPADVLRTAARHPYTRALLATVPDMAAPRDQPLAVIPGRPVDPAAFPAGCAFAPRCPFASDRCRREDPPLVATSGRHRVACWHPQDGPLLLPLPVIRTIEAEGI